MKIKQVISISILFVFTACSANKEGDSSPAPLYPQPQSYEANPKGGYNTNPITGDTILPLINYFGDTVITGVPIKLEGKIIHPDSFAKPETFIIPDKSQLIVKNAHPNVHKIPNDLTKIAVNLDSLTRIYIEPIMDDDTLHYIINSTGDTLKTGIPIKVEGEKIVAVQPQPTKALSQRFKDAANTNLQYLDVDQGMPNSYIRSMLLDRKGNIWFGTSGGGVSKYDGTNFTNYSEKEGLSSNAVFCMTEDQFGNIWFGTNEGGACVYDGESFTHFKEKDGLSNNTVFSIIEDKKGNIWFGTYKGGVCRYDGNRVDAINAGRAVTDQDRQELISEDGEFIKTFKHFTTHEGLSHNFVISILEDQKGMLWFTTSFGGVNRYDGESFTHFSGIEGLNLDAVWTILEDKKGNIWFAPNGNGLSCYDGNRVDAINAGKPPTESDLKELKWEDGKPVRTFTQFTDKEGLSSNKIWSSIEDKNGNLWFGSGGNGINRFDGETFTHITEKEGLSNNYIWSILEDNSGSLWFGTFAGGVNRYDAESFKYFTEKEGLPPDHPTLIKEVKNGDIWIGMGTSGACRYDGETFTYFTEKEGLSNNAIWSIIEDKKGSIWFGTNGGGVSKLTLNAKSEGTFTHYGDNEGLISNNIILSMLTDKNGDLWFGTNGGGVSKLSLLNIDGHERETFTHYSETEGFNNNNVWSMLKDKSGNLWFGTGGGGVSRYDGVRFTHFTEKEGLSNNHVWSIFEDQEENMWFGTGGGGLCRYDGNRVDAINKGREMTDKDRQELKIADGELVKSFLCFTEKEGLSSNYVMTITGDKNSKNGVHLWVGTQKGLNKIIIDNPKSSSDDTNENTPFSPNVRIHKYQKKDGLKGGNFRLMSIIDSKNRAWWSTNINLTMLDLNKHNTAKKPPTIYLRQLHINGQFIDYINGSDSLLNQITYQGVEKFDNYPLNLELPHNKSHLTFHFSAIDWNAPQKIQYSFRLIGLNDNWSEPSKETKADYRNISYGDFTFEVKAIGESQEWSESFEYSFSIQPPWWHTWWARVLYVLSAIFILFGFVKWRTAKLKKRQKELESEVKNATHEIRKRKEQVEQAHTEITDSINYAERIQRSFLASKELLDENLPEYFIFFRPKDVVSGDFYWATKLDNGNFIIVNADSTGHGVPGAIMSILNISSLEKAIAENLIEPAAIFNHTRKAIIDRLKKDGSEEGGKDGMDASIINFDFPNMSFSYTVAQNPIWIVRDNELIEIKPEKMPVGKHDQDDIPFSQGTFELKKEDQIYTLTDGFQDQFGGPKQKKFMTKNLRNFILTNSHLPIQEQKEKLHQQFVNWKGDLDQIDDICIIGIRI